MFLKAKQQQCQKATNKPNPIETARSLILKIRCHGFAGVAVIDLTFNKL